MKTMKRLILIFISLCAFQGLAYSGSYSETYSGKGEVAPCPEWYGNNEWNVSIWGTYSFTGTEFAPNPSLVDLIQSTSEGHTVFGTFDRYVGNDHAWGGGADIKYFFARYFGIGIQGFGLDAKRSSFEIDSRPLDGILVLEHTTDRRVVGSVLGTITLRYPIPCSRFSPYAWAGVGAIFGGGERDKVITSEIPGAPETEEGEVPFVNARTEHFDSRTELMGQFGGGLEYRFTRNIGWTGDFNWNVVNGAHNDFGMFRTGINFAF
jgi:hypothetical protein